MSISERATAGSQPKKPPRVTCPCCEATFDPTRAGKPRSTDQHRRFFGMLAAVHQHWPEGHRFQPDNAEQLRAWLLVRAGHHTIKTFFLNDDASELAKIVPIITATMLGKYSWARPRGNELHVCVPESIAFDKMEHQAFCKLNDAVDEVIRVETGLDPNQLLKQTETAS